MIVQMLSGPDSKKRLALIKSESTSTFDSVLLDANIAIALEKLYYTPGKLDTEYRELLTQFLVENASKDFVPGFAIREACWDYTAMKEDPQQTKIMEEALLGMWSMNDYETFHIHFNKGGAGSRVATSRKSTASVRSFADQYEVNPLLLASYTTILKIHSLQRQTQSRSRESIIMELADFMNNKTKRIAALEWALAIDYFLGANDRPNYVSQILKFGSKNVPHASWTAAWDLFYLRLLQQAITGEFENVLERVRKALMFA